MKVTALKQQIKNPERVSVFVDSKYTFSLTLNQVVSEGMKVGLDLSDERLLELKQKSTDEKLRMKAMNWTLLRPRSERELRDYLKRTMYKQKTSSGLGSTQVASPENIELIVEEFIRRGWVDDETFARWWVERSSRVKKSTSFLTSELLQKGVSREIVGEILGGRNEEESLAALIKKLRSKPKYSDETKLARYLVSKGFRYSSVTEALRLDADDRLG